MGAIEDIIKKVSLQNARPQEEERKANEENMYRGFGKRRHKIYLFIYN